MDSETEIYIQKAILGVFSATTAMDGTERQNVNWHVVVTKTTVSPMGALTLGRPCRAAFS